MRKSSGFLNFILRSRLTEPAAVFYGYAAISGTGPVLVGTIPLISVSMGRNVIKMKILCHIFFGRMIIFVMQKCSNIIKT